MLRRCSRTIRAIAGGVRYIGTCMYNSDIFDGDQRAEMADLEKQDMD
jgi:hypothetical protein